MWLFYVNSSIRADFWSIQHNRRQPFESKTIKRASQPNMTVPFKFLPHKILNKPKPAPTVCIYPLWPYEFFIPKLTEKPAAPSKLMTTIRVCLWSQNPQHPPPKKKREKKGWPTQAHQLPAAKTHKSALSRHRPISHLPSTPSSPSTAAVEDVEPLPMPRLEIGSYHSSMLCVAIVFPAFMPPPVVDP